MAGVPCATVELATKTSTIYISTHKFDTASGDTPSLTPFAPRIISDFNFRRAAGLVFHGKRPRGERSIGVIRVANADGVYDSLVGNSLRDKSIIVKRGDSLDAYSTFSLVATLLVDRIEFEDEATIAIYTKSISAKLERAWQQTMYPTTISNKGLVGTPRPRCFGKVFQIPLAQPDMFGNGRYDVHDGDQWIGVDQFMDKGSTPSYDVGYRRSHTSGIYGIDRLQATEGKQVANVQGAFVIVDTPYTDDFTSLASWNEFNGGVAGRDASIVGNALNLVNTAGGAELQLFHATTTATSATENWYYEFDVTAWVSGSVQFRSTFVGTEQTISEVGRYTGMAYQAANFNPRFYVLNGSNGSLTIDNFRARRVRLIESLPDVMTYVCVTTGPLVSGDLDSTSINALDAATGYKYGYFAKEAVQIADILDWIAASYGGWWGENRSGKIVTNRLTAPSGSPVLAFTDSMIGPEGINIQFDAAPGLSNVILAKKNWSPYDESELATSLNYLQLNPSDKDADVTLSNSNYTYANANVGSVRSLPAIFGERIYFEVLANTVDGTQQHYIGVANTTPVITNYPGQDSTSFAYRANGQYVTGAAGTAFGAAWAANDRIGVALDMRRTAHGAQIQNYRLYFHKNGSYQGSGSPTTEANFKAFPGGLTNVAHLMVGANVAAANGGTVNFGQSPFTTPPPAEYYAPAWHKVLITSPYRFRYISTTALASEYVHALANGPATARGDAGQELGSGIETLFSVEANAISECDRWCGLYATERFFYSFSVFLDAAASDQLEPGDLISVTHARFGLSAKLLRVLEIEGNVLERSINLVCWG